MMSDNENFQRIITHFDEFYVWGKFEYFDVFYNGYERTEQIWIHRLSCAYTVTQGTLRISAGYGH